MTTEKGSVRDMPLVAIVTPSYNGGKYLDKAMACVQAQTYANLVHIVLDNASTDDTPEIIQRYANSRVPVLSYRNPSLLKLQDNWNKAFSHVPAEAAYMKLLCADDLIRPDAIEKFVRLAQSDTEISIVLCDDVFDDHIRCANLSAGQTVFDGRSVARSILDGQIGWLPYPHFFIRVPKLQPGESLLGDDWSQDLNIVVASALRGNVGYIHEPLVYTRYHDESVTGKQVTSKAINGELMEFTLISRYAPQIYGGQSRNPAMTVYMDRMCRFILQWSLKGYRGRAAELRRALAERGLKFSLWDYIRAILAWPAYTLKKPHWRRSEATAVNEKRFLQAT